MEWGDWESRLGDCGGGRADREEGKAAQAGTFSGCWITWECGRGEGLVVGGCIRGAARQWCTVGGGYGGPLSGVASCWEGGRLGGSAKVEREVAIAHRITWRAGKRRIAAWADAASVVSAAGEASQGVRVGEWVARGWLG